MCETVLTSLTDAGVGAGLKRAHKAALLCGLMSCVGLVYVSRGGLHWVNLLDGYSANLTLFIVGGLECVAVGWCYGAERFAVDTLEMTGCRLPKPLLWTYTVLIPAMLAALTVPAFVSTALGEKQGDSFPPHAVALGWVLALVSALLIPLMALGPLCCVAPTASADGGSPGCLPFPLRRKRRAQPRPTFPHELPGLSADEEIRQITSIAVSDAPHPLDPR